MQVSELVKLAKWYHVNVVENGVEKAYINLRDRISENTRNGQRTSFEIERDNLTSMLRRMSLNGLTIESVEFLKKQGLYELLGETGAENIEDVIYKSGIDIASALQHFQEMCNTLAKGRELFIIIETKIGTAFGTEDDEFGEGETLMRIYFHEGAAISNMADFKKSATLWFDIARGAALAMDARPEDIRVVSAEKGSVIINVVVGTGVAAVFCKMVLEILKIAHEILKIKATSKEIEKLDIENQLIKEQLEAAIAEKRSSGVDNICNNIAMEYDIVDGEKIRALTKAIEKLMGFLEKGGSVDFVHADAKENEEEQQIGESQCLRDASKELITDIEKIREIEGQILMIENARDD